MSKKIIDEAIEYVKELFEGTPIQITILPLSS